MGFEFFDLALAGLGASSYVLLQAARDSRDVWRRNGDADGARFQVPPWAMLALLTAWVLPPLVVMVGDVSLLALVDKRIAEFGRLNPAVLGFFVQGAAHRLAGLERRP
jgi:hypothetical protein